jgi:methionine sulfoxide reductase catalytic subunit
MLNEVLPTPAALPAAAPSNAPPDSVRSYRWQLTPGEDLIDTATWAASVPQVNGIAPRVRCERGKWFKLLTQRVHHEHRWRRW